MQAVRDCILLQITDIWTSSVQRKVEIKLVYSTRFVYIHFLVQLGLVSTKPEHRCKIFLYYYYLNKAFRVDIT